MMQDFSDRVWDWFGFTLAHIEVGKRAFEWTGEIFPKFKYHTPRGKAPSYLRDAANKNKKYAEQISGHIRALLEGLETLEVLAVQCADACVDCFDDCSEATVQKALEQCSIFNSTRKHLPIQSDIKILPPIDGCSNHELYIDIELLEKSLRSIKSEFWDIFDRKEYLVVFPISLNQMRESETIGVFKDRIRQEEVAPICWTV
ncbi:hypothetical protein GCM10011332_32520 [Terasakiella brassicae]|uniref:Uncharacterized protein n=1 Tax=Terasakiella brassicae TaxID=1634917 RepID=A0A917C8A8_9PROT|nr:hypothetical protein [Terasakiella brassicae]GGF76043.1 hypothetical protein GCM10011332_32520 [Terasakiella brassicae]